MIRRISYAVVEWVIFGTINIALVLLGLPAVALSLLGDGQDRTPAMWRLWGKVEDIPDWWYARNGNRSRYTKWWWMAIRNPASGTSDYIPPSPIVREYSNTIDMELPGFKWRYRHTKWRDSFRMTWGKVRPSKGKHEFYIGFKIGPDVDTTGFTMQLR